MTIISIICVLIIATLFFGGFWYIAVLIIGIPLAYGLHIVIRGLFEEHFERKLKKYCKKKGVEFNPDVLPRDGEW